MVAGSTTNGIVLANSTSNYMANNFIGLSGYGTAFPNGLPSAWPSSPGRITTGWSATHTGRTSLGRRSRRQGRRRQLSSRPGRRGRRDPDRQEGEIEERTGFETRMTILGHIQRGGTPLAYDRVLGTLFGVEAIDAAHQGDFGRMVALRGTEIVRVPPRGGPGRAELIDPKLSRDRGGLLLAEPLSGARASGPRAATPPSRCNRRPRSARSSPARGRGPSGMTSLGPVPTDS